jgi:DNA polymerase-3 subunit beta
MQIGYNSRFLTEMLTNLQSDMIMLEMSLPNRAGILTPVDGLEEGETVTMLVMPVCLIVNKNYVFFVAIVFFD